MATCISISKITVENYNQFGLIGGEVSVLFPSVCSLTSRILSLSDGRTPPSPSGPISKGGLYIFVQGDLYESPSRL